MHDHLHHELVSALHDDELTAAEREIAERRLAESPELRRELEEIREVSATLATAALKAPDGLREAILRQVERESLLTDSEPEPFVVAPPQPAPFDSTGSVRPAPGRDSAAGRVAWLSAAAALATTAAVLLLAVRVFEDAAPHPGGDVRGLAHADKSPHGGDEVAFTAPTEEKPREAGQEIVADELRTLSTPAATRDVPDESHAAADPLRPVVPPAPAPDATKKDDRARAARTAAVPGDGEDPTAGFVGPHELGAANRLEELERFRLRFGDREARLRFDDSLKEAEVGDVVSALEARGNEVAVVRLTVVDRREGLAALQLLLLRNDVTPEPATADGGGAGRAENETQPEPGAGGRPLVDAAPVEDPESRADRRDRELLAGTLEAVFVQATPEQLTATLTAMRRNATFRELAVDAPVSLAGLEAYNRTAGNPATEHTLREIREQLALADADFGTGSDQPEARGLARGGLDGLRPPSERNSPQPSASKRSVTAPSATAPSAKSAFEKSRIAAVPRANGPPADGRPPAEPADADTETLADARSKRPEGTDQPGAAEPSTDKAEFARKGVEPVHPGEVKPADETKLSTAPAPLTAAAGEAGPLRESARGRQQLASRQYSLLVPSGLGRSSESEMEDRDPTATTPGAIAPADSLNREEDGFLRGDEARRELAEGASRDSVPLSRGANAPNGQVAVLFVLVAEMPPVAGPAAPPASPKEEGGGA